MLFQSRLTEYKPRLTASGDILGGHVNALYLGGLSALDQTTVDVFSGVYINTYIETYGATTLNIYGGRMPDNYLWAKDTSEVNLYVTSYLYQPGAGQYGDGVITGTWGDNSPFEIILFDPGTFEHINIVPIPEPASILCLVAVGDCNCRATGSVSSPGSPAASPR